MRAGGLPLNECVTVDWNILGSYLSLSIQTNYFPVQNFCVTDLTNMDFLVQIMPNTHAQISSYKSLFVVLLLCFNTIVNNNNNNNKFTTKDSYTWNITHNTESTAV